jgi:hypothetical protein
MTPSPDGQSEQARFPPDDLVVDFGKPCPGTSNPMPAEVRAAYEERILASIEAQHQGAKLAGTLYVG